MLVVNGYLGYYEIPTLLISQNVERFLIIANVVFLIMFAGFAVILNDC